MRKKTPQSDIQKRRKHLSCSNEQEQKPSNVVRFEPRNNRTEEKELRNIIRFAESKINW